MGQGGAPLGPMESDAAVLDEDPRALIAPPPPRSRHPASEHRRLRVDERQVLGQLVLGRVVGRAVRAPDRLLPSRPVVPRPVEVEGVGARVLLGKARLRVPHATDRRLQALRVARGRRNRRLGRPPRAGRGAMRGASHPWGRQRLVRSPGRRPGGREPPRSQLGVLGCWHLSLGASSRRRRQRRAGGSLVHDARVRPVWEIWGECADVGLACCGYAPVGAVAG